jgi:selT/selW/selH-like putative selenoprotein
MKRNFVSVAEFLEQTFPELAGKIEGANYPPPPLAELMGNMLSLVQMIFLLWMVLGGEKILRLLGYIVLPPWHQTVQSYSLQVGLALFLVLPQVLSKWMITGAFEIYLDDKRIWSRLETGNFPTMDNLINLLTDNGLRART